MAKYTASKNATADNKPKLRFIHPDTKAAIAKAHMAGDLKYPALPEESRTEYGTMNFLQDDPHGYLSLSSLLDAMERHIDAIKSGEWYDADSCDRLGDKEVEHLGNIGACLNMIFARKAKGNLKDDRPFVSKDDILKGD